MNFENLKNMVTDKEQWVKVGKKAGQLSKVVVVEGIKAVALKGTAKVVTTSFDEGIAGVKKLTFDEVVGIKEEESKPKMKLFSKKKKKEEIEELLDEVDEVKEKLEEAKKLAEETN